ncbi:GFA family protein [Bosea sp. BH3]|uniref:GFA family protein n=1 Tax=Bosea sp. BH3 TaxID=2871701 RepID=UPI0021CAFFDF|nr:GFA family protein [Bosea sp. BH3]MCU4179376.1 GFA family protein [Bosea sp. BH3]
MAGEAVVQAACHCRRVRFEVTLAEGFDKPRRCDCSFCRMRGAVVVGATRDGVRIVAGEDALAEYQFNTGTARHFFCSACGIYTHHLRRSSPGQIAVNVACIEGASPFDFAEVPVSDGINHPSDQPAGAKGRLAGILRYERARE